MIRVENAIAQGRRSIAAIQFPLADAGEALRLARQSTCVDSTERSEVSRSVLQGHEPQGHEHASPVGLGDCVLLPDATADPERGCGYNQTLSQLSCIPELLDLSLEEQG